MGEGHVRRGMHVGRGCVQGHTPVPWVLSTIAMPLALKPLLSAATCKNLELQHLGTKSATNLGKILLQAKFQRSASDPCFYTKCKSEKLAYLLTYETELFLAYECPDDSKEVIDHLSQPVELTDLADVTYYLGIQIEREPDSSFLIHQEQKIGDLVKT